MNLVVVKITLTSPDKNSLKVAQKKIEQLARTCSDEKRLTENTELIDWPQETIKTYYLFCLQKNVLPTMKIGQGTLDLLGPKEAVSEPSKGKANRFPLSPLGSRSGKLFLSADRGNAASHTKLVAKVSGRNVARSKSNRSTEGKISLSVRLALDLDRIVFSMCVAFQLVIRVPKRVDTI